ncbi:PEP-CTERM sorting domain-containing protein [Paraglaciecola sp. 25GB23A]|uniref:PEP-CTERM sorting domain-containing protein n=1 Tax=Paraglaciecola sp. 25GB23A TaxID=3156068 RepID=UPI0032AFCF22
MKVKKLLNYFLGPICILFWINSVNATPILLGTSVKATGIQNLAISGQLYHVTFSDISSYANTFTTQPTFINDQVGANIAAQAILTVLNNNSVTGISNLVDLSVNGSLWVQIPYQVDGNFVFSELLLLPTANGQWQTYPTFPDDINIVYNNVSWVSFAHSVPVPSTTILFCTSLLCIMLRRRLINS